VGEASFTGEAERGFVDLSTVCHPNGKTRTQVPLVPCCTLRSDSQNPIIFYREGSHSKLMSGKDNNVLLHLFSTCPVLVSGLNTLYLSI
jgi:hypothetical protein